MPKLAKTNIRQVLPLTPAQAMQIRALINSNADAAAHWYALESAAQSASRQTPHPLSNIVYEGVLDTVPARQHTTACLADMDQLALLLQATPINDQVIYREQIKQITLAWIAQYQPTGNPINENKLQPLLFASWQYRAQWSAAEQLRVTAWLEHMATTLTHASHTDQRTFHGNWHTKLLLLLGLLGLALNDHALIGQTIERVRTYIHTDLYPDGSSYDLHKRDALAYHQSGLEPLVVFARLFQDQVGDLYHWQAANGASIAAGLKLMEPYVRGEQQHAEWLHTTVELDRQRAAAGLSYYQPGKLYNPQSALELFDLAAVYEPTYTPLVAQLAGRAETRFPTWNSIINATEIELYAHS
jgi:hypothetical protein